MSIDQVDKIDIISTAQDGKVILTISDHLPWDKSNEHLLLLQNKINSYLAYIETGQIFEDYPNAQYNNLVIRISMQYEPDDIALRFLNLCHKTIRKSGFELSWQVIS